MKEKTGTDYSQFIRIQNEEDTTGVPPVVSFQVQSDPISIIGINGIQAVDIIRYAACLIESLNTAFPCDENSSTIFMLEEAIHWQNKRTQNRTERGVEGKNEA
jgi:hypothetical protein